MENTSTIASMDMGQSLGKAWDAVKANIWLFAGFTVVYYIAYFILAMIPFVGQLAGFFSFIFGASIFTAYATYEKNGKLEFNEFFSWSPRFGRLFTGHLLMIGIGILIFIPLIIAFFALIGFSALGTIVSDPSPENIMALFGSSFVIFILICLAVGLFFMVWFFAYPYIVLYTDMPLMDAMRLSWKIGRNNIGQLILFVLLGIGLSILGTLCLLIGLTVTIPLMFGAQFFFLRSILPSQDDQQWDFMNSGSAE